MIACNCVAEHMVFFVVVVVAGDRRAYVGHVYMCVCCEMGNVVILN